LLGSDRRIIDRMLPVRDRVTGSLDAPNAMSLYSKTDAIAARQRNDAIGQRTKSLRDSPLRGGKSGEAGSR